MVINIQVYVYLCIKIMEEFERLINLIGREKFERISKLKIAIFGIGGVGGYVCEGLARCGVNSLFLVDFDTVSKSNINRQIIATNETLNLYKVDVMKNRILSINKNCNVEILKVKIDKNTINDIDFTKFDFIVDAIDMVSSKLFIIEKAKKFNVDIISCMGTGNKLDATKLQIVDISKTSMCPLAKVMRKELRKRNINKLTVLFSTEEQKCFGEKSRIPASIVFVPSVAGLLISNYIIKKVIGDNGKI